MNDYKIKGDKSNYKISFGKGRTHSKSDSYSCMNVELQMRASESGASASISFNIFEGYPEGMFDMKEIEASRTLTLEEAEILADKLNEFIKNGNGFLKFINGVK